MATSLTYHLIFSSFPPSSSLSLLLILHHRFSFNYYHQVAAFQINTTCYDLSCATNVNIHLICQKSQSTDQQLLSTYYVLGPKDKAVERAYMFPVFMELMNSIRVPPLERSAGSLCGQRHGSCLHCESFSGGTEINQSFIL